MKNVNTGHKDCVTCKYTGHKHTVSTDLAPDTTNHASNAGNTGCEGCWDGINWTSWTDQPERAQDRQILLLLYVLRCWLTSDTNMLCYTC